MKASKIQELVEMLHNGEQPVVQFTAEIAELEGYFDVGMRAKVISAYQNVSEDSYTVIFDVNDHNDYNLQFEVPNFYGTKESDPKLTASQAGWNPLTRKGGNGSEDYYFAGFDETEYFTILEVEGSTLYDEYVEGKSSDTYVKWLENRVLAAREEHNDSAGWQ
jgi:hypothetical protein